MGRKTQPKPLRKTPKKPRPEPTQVFLNVPFDDEYRDLLLALVCSIVCIGKQPRSALEVRETGIGRMEKIMDLIIGCGYSINDLSRMPGGKEKLPRMNMAFELGIVYAMEYTKRGKYQWFLLESKLHRLSKTLSDLAGHDPRIHSNKPAAIIKIVVEWFKPLTEGFKFPTPKKVLKVFEDLKALIPKLREEHCGEPPFEELVYAAGRIAEKKRVIPKPN